VRRFSAGLLRFARNDADRWDKPGHDEPKGNSFSEKFMSSNPSHTSQIVVADYACERPDGTAMLMRVARPTTGGRFPAVVDVHGGGWVTGDRNQNALIDDTLARNGIVVAAPEFRMPPHARYPGAIADVHLAIRWLKANAIAFGSRPDLVGGMGTSSGGHQLLECILKPNRSEYAQFETAAVGSFTAEVSYAVLGWPVADPLARFRYAKETGLAQLVKAHEAYWPSEHSMAEGSPQHVVEQRLFEALPHLLLLHGTKDDNVPLDMAVRFADAYHSAGGKAQLHRFAGMPHAFVTRHPDAPESLEALAMVVSFIQKHAFA
jgi:acetyl esterase/lipase